MYLIETTIGALSLPCARALSEPTETAAMMAGRSRKFSIKATLRPLPRGSFAAGIGMARLGRTNTRPRSRSSTGESPVGKSMVPASPEMRDRAYSTWFEPSTTRTKSWSKNASSQLPRWRSIHCRSCSTLIACVALAVPAALSTSRNTPAPRATIASWTSCCSRVSEASFACRAEVITAYNRQATATAAITPTGTIRRNRARSQRDRPVSSAIFSCAEVVKRYTPLF